MDIQTVTTNELFILSKSGNDFCTSSRIIADALGKKHKNVLQKIEELLANVKKNPLLEDGLKNKLISEFHKRTYVDEMNREKPEYLIKQEGFTQLMNSFADGGEKNERVLAWKVKFNEAWHKMKAILENKQEITVNADKNIIPQEQSKILIANDTVTFTKNICELFGDKVDKGEVFVSTLQFAEKTYNLDLSDVKMIAPPKKENFITATELTAQIEKDLNIIIRGKGSKKTATLNRFLEQQGYIEKIESKWTVTSKGEQYGHLTPCNTNGKTFYNLMWSTRFVPIIETEIKSNLLAVT